MDTETRLTQPTTANQTTMTISLPQGWIKSINQLASLRGETASQVISTALQDYTWSRLNPSNSPAGELIGTSELDTSFDACYQFPHDLTQMFEWLPPSYHGGKGIEAYLVYVLESKGRKLALVQPCALGGILPKSAKPFPPELGKQYGRMAGALITLEELEALQDSLLDDLIQAERGLNLDKK